MPDEPVSRDRTGTAAAIKSAAEATRLTTGRRKTAPAIAPQKRPSLASRSAMRPKKGTRHAFTRSPRRLRSAGSKVSAAITETMATRIAPAARLRKIELGTSTSPNIASTKASPLKRTARLAVAPAAPIASSFSRPCERSSR
jgi:hypothetical protein